MRAAARHFRLSTALGAVLWLVAAELAPAQTPGAAATAPMGATVVGDGASRRVIFRTWAPNAAEVAVSGDFNGWKEEPLQPEAGRPGHWALESRRARPGDAYRFIIDGLQRRDPRARAVSQEQNKSIILDPR